jgi:hypothetical protein
MLLRTCRRSLRGPGGPGGGAARRALTTTANSFLPDEVQMLQSAVRDFADAELVPQAGAWDKKGEMDDSMRQAIRGLGHMGLMGVAIDPEYGGTGMDYLSYAVAMEEVSVRGGWTRGCGVQREAPPARCSLLLCVVVCCSLLLWCCCWCCCCLCFRPPVFQGGV